MRAQRAARTRWAEAVRRSTPDGHATALRGVGAMVLVADCLPVALGAGGAVAVLHAGWRGLAAGVLEEGVRALRELGGEGEIGRGRRSRGGALLLRGRRGGARGVRRRSPCGARDIDLPALARDRLLAAGVDAR